MEEKVYEYLKALVAVPGISDTDDEKMAAERIGEILKAQSYFQVYPENFGEIMIPGDAKKRPLVYGLVRGIRVPGGRSFLPVIMMWSVWRTMVR